jgi:hypothetical protein
VPREAIDDVSRRVGGIPETELSLEGTRRLIQLVMRVHQEGEHQLRELGGDHLRDGTYYVVEEIVQLPEDMGRPTDSGPRIHQ